MSDTQRMHRSSYMSGYRQALADIQVGRSMAGRRLGKTSLLLADDRVRIVLALRELTAIIGDPNWPATEDIETIIRKRLLTPALQLIAEAESHR